MKARPAELVAVTARAPAAGADAGGQGAVFTLHSYKFGIHFAVGDVAGIDLRNLGGGVMGKAPSTSGLIWRMA